MSVESVLPLVIGISLLALGVAWLLAREVLAADTGKPEMRAISDAIREGAEAFLSRQYRTIAMLAIVAAAAIFGFYFLNRDVREHRGDGRGHLLEGHALVRARRGLLGDRRLHRHVGLDPRQHPHGGRGDDEPQRRAADRAARRRGLGPVRRGDEPARRGRASSGSFGGMQDYAARSRC